MNEQANYLLDKYEQRIAKLEKALRDITDICLPYIYTRIVLKQIFNIAKAARDGKGESGQ